MPDSRGYMANLRNADSHVVIKAPADFSLYALCCQQPSCIAHIEIERHNSAANPQCGCHINKRHRNCMTVDENSPPSDEAIVKATASIFPMSTFRLPDAEMHSLLKLPCRFLNDDPQLGDFRRRLVKCPKRQAAERSCLQSRIIALIRRLQSDFKIQRVCLLRV
jgi:hypothetical protein